MAADRSVVVFAGLGTEGTWDCIRRFPDHGGATAEVMIMEADGPLRRLAVPCSPKGRGIAAAAHIDSRKCSSITTLRRPRQILIRQRRLTLRLRRPHRKRTVGKRVTPLLSSGTD